MHLPRVIVVGDMLWQSSDTKFRLTTEANTGWLRTFQRRRFLWSHHTSTGGGAWNLALNVHPKILERLYLDSSSELRSMSTIIGSNAQHIANPSKICRADTFPQVHLRIFVFDEDIYQDFSQWFARNFRIGVWWQKHPHRKPNFIWCMAHIPPMYTYTIVLLFFEYSKWLSIWSCSFT